MNAAVFRCFAVAALAVLTGCGRGPSSDAPAMQLLTPAASLREPIIDDTGTRLALRAPATRIMSLTPGTTEMLFAAGAGSHIIATVLSADFPEAARKIPRVGDATSLDYEKVFQARADVVVVWGNVNPAPMIERVRSFKLPVYVIRSATLRDIPRSIERLGVLSGTEETARAAAAALDLKINALAARIQPNKPTEVFYQIWEGPIYTIGGQHIISDALRLCGARNIFEDLKWPANVIGREAIVKRDPEIIFLSAPVLTAREWAGYWNYYPQMRAVANKKVQIWTDERLDRMGPTAIDAVQNLCTTLDTLRSR